MTPIRDLCRVILTTSLSNRHIADTLHLAPNTVGRYRQRLAELSLTWSDVVAWDEQITALVKPSTGGGSWTSIWFRSWHNASV